MKKKMLAVFAAALLAAALTAGPGSSASKDGRQLYGDVGPGFTIHLKDADGNNVTSLRPGVYWLNVSDMSSHHNFHLFGGDGNAIDFTTTVPFVGDVTSVKLLLKHGDYVFQCDPHALTGMKGTFTVGGVGQDS
jgi:hypothetical protein